MEREGAGTSHLSQVSAAELGRQVLVIGGRFQEKERKGAGR